MRANSSSFRSPLGLLALVALVAPLGLAGCVTPPGPDAAATAAGATQAAQTTAPATTDVKLTGMAFVDKSVDLFVGDTIVWAHEDGPLTPHTVTTDDGAAESFDSHPMCVGLPVSGVCMVGGDTFTHVFETEGEVGIHCNVHGSSMSMTVTVRSR